MIDFMSRNAERTNQKQVRFSEADGFDDDVDFRNRSYSNDTASPAATTHRRRTMSLGSPNFNQLVKEDPSTLYRVVNVTATGGEVRRLAPQSWRLVPLNFNVAYTTLSGVPLSALQDLASMVRCGDVVRVTHRIEFLLGNGRTEWRATDMEFPSVPCSDILRYTATTPSTLQGGTGRMGVSAGGSYVERRPSRPLNGSNASVGGSSAAVWVTFGRVSTIGTKRKYLIIKTGVKENMIFADEIAIVGELCKFKENVTVLVRAEFRRNTKSVQPPSVPWYAVNVQAVGPIKTGQGTLKQVRMGDRAPFVIVANNFGWVMVPRENQCYCKKLYRDGEQVEFTACFNLPCAKYSKNTRHHTWKMLNFVDFPKNTEKKDDEKPTKTNASCCSTIFPTNLSVATSCRSCRGPLVCTCYN